MFTIAAMSFLQIRQLLFLAASYLLKVKNENTIKMGEIF